MWLPQEEFVAKLTSHVAKAYGSLKSTGDMALSSLEPQLLCPQCHGLIDGFTDAKQVDPPETKKGLSKEPSTTPNYTDAVQAALQGNQDKKLDEACDDDYLGYSEALKAQYQKTKAVLLEMLKVFIGKPLTDEIVGILAMKVNAYYANQPKQEAVEPVSVCDNKDCACGGSGVPVVEPVLVCNKKDIYADFDEMKLLPVKTIKLQAHVGVALAANDGSQPLLWGGMGNSGMQFLVDFIKLDMS